MEFINDNRKITFEEFIVMDNNTEDNLELINGKVYLLSAPSSTHQMIVTKLSTEIGIYLKNKNCIHFVAPFDVYFEEEGETHKVQPDITVICDKSGLSEKGYKGVPVLIIEVLSPSTASKDYIEKMDLYMRIGVKEYWIVSPKNKTVEVFTLTNEKTYEEPMLFSYPNIIKSSVFEDLSINSQMIFGII